MDILLSCYTQATGCGKTHTISGTESDPGIIYLTMADLFDKIRERRTEYNVDISISFLEIYNEEIRDLLAEPGSYIPRGGLQIREDKTVKVVGLVELHPTSADEIKQIVIQGNARRTQSPTHANETSSRSHAVLQVHITQSPRTASTTEERTLATLSIIDLAGSERAAATQNMGQRMVEGANINKSLLALGNCINALCESGGATRHVPYRNSKLTRLLKFSLGGNCQTVMIVCVAPTSNHYDDTHNTLLYADRASKIKTKVITRNVVNVDRHVGQYVEAINRLNAEVAELKAKLADKWKSEAEDASRKREQAKTELRRMQGDIHRKAEQTQTSILDGAYCLGKIGVAQAKISPIQMRLEQIRGQRATQQSLPGLDIEETFLKTLASPEEPLLSPESVFNTRLQRATNASHMFEAVLRAVSERKSDRLQEQDMDIIGSDIQYQRAELDKSRAEREKEVFKEAVATQAMVITKLVGSLAQCIATMEDGSQIANNPTAEGLRSLTQTLKSCADSQKSVFMNTASQSPAHTPESCASSSNLKSTSFSFTVPHVQTGTSDPRRMSYGTLPSPHRRNHRASPRKSRSSLLPGTHTLRRVVSDKAQEKKKSVQWKDYSGQGSLDDREPSATLAVETGSPEKISIGNSESDWEDEKTDESLSNSFSMVSAEATSHKFSGKRFRASRLDPAFLKNRGGQLGSLAEDDESCQADITWGKRPLSDCINQMSTEDTSDSSRPATTLAGLQSPRRLDSTLRSNRRRSNIGPLRSDKGRRRSSLLPRPSPTGGESVRGGARRVAINQTPRRTKRTSLLGVSRTSIPARHVQRTSNQSLDSNASGDISFRGTKPTWR